MAWLTGSPGIGRCEPDGAPDESSIRTRRTHAVADGEVLVDADKSESGLDTLASKGARHGYACTYEHTDLGATAVPPLTCLSDAQCRCASNDATQRYIPARRHVSGIYGSPPKDAMSRLAA